MRAWPEEDKTAWFIHYKHPMHIGVYEVTWRGIDGIVESGYAWWDGQLWGWTAKFPEYVIQHGSAGANQRKMWRGLREGALIKATEGMRS